MTTDPATTSEPAPYPALVAILREWVAQHADFTDGGYIQADPESIWFTVHLPIRRDSSKMYRDVFADLEDRVRTEGLIPSGFEFDVMCYTGVSFPDHPIALDDPNAPAIIADRVRTADDLRAELAKVTAERDEARRLLRQVMGNFDAAAHLVDTHWDEIQALFTKEAESRA